jgi:hypothetical protein
MATFNFDKFLDAVKSGVVDVAKTEAVDFIEDTKADGDAFIEEMKKDLLMWTEQLADGLLSPDEFEFLVKGKKDLAKMEALKRAGVGAAKVDAVRKGVMKVVVTAALATL